MKIRPLSIALALLTYGTAAYSQTISATFLPHGPADPLGSVWTKPAYRDIPWWFHDDNSYWADNNLTPGASDAYDIAVVYAARLNKNNVAGYEAAIINTPAYTHGNYNNSNPYGSPGGAITGNGSNSADNVTWGNGTVWDFALVYDWNNANPFASMTFTNGTTTHTTYANLGSQVKDFVDGTGPYLEQHALNDVMMRFATIGNYDATPKFTKSAVTVTNLRAGLNGDPSKLIEYKDENGVIQSSLTTEWNHVAGGTAETNPRQVEFLVINNLLNSHTDRLDLTGQFSFAWNGNANNISGSGVMVEFKLGDLDFFPDATPDIPDPDSWGEPVPEPTALVLVLAGFAWMATRHRRRAGC